MFDVTGVHEIRDMLPRDQIFRSNYKNRKVNKQYEVGVWKWKHVQYSTGTHSEKISAYTFKRILSERKGDTLKAATWSMINVL